MGISERDLVSQCDLRRKLIFEAVSDPPGQAGRNAKQDETKKERDYMKKDYQ